MRERLDEIEQSINTEKDTPSDVLQITRSEVVHVENNRKDDCSILALPDGSAQRIDADTATTDRNDDNYWRIYACNIVSSNVQLIVEHETESQLKSAIEKSLLHDASGVPGSRYVACLYDAKLAGEPITAPHLRVTPCKKTRVKKLFSAFLKARSQDGKSMRSGDVCLIHDGGKAGNVHKFTAPFQEFCGRKGFSRKTVTALFEEDSVKSRKSRVKGVAVVQP